MSADVYLQNVLSREAVDTAPSSPVRGVQDTLQPVIAQWAGTLLNGVGISGSFMKGTANKSGNDIDLFISLAERTTATLAEIYESLFKRMSEAGYRPKRQNVSINVTVNGYSVDLVPGKQQSGYTTDHSIYRRRVSSWQKTNITTHIIHVRQAGRLNESRILKLWRNQKGLDFPSFYVELTVIAALAGQYGALSDNVWSTFKYLRDRFTSARGVDPANTNNVISDDLTAAEKLSIQAAADRSLGAKTWQEIVQ
ncbi:hypothetical protein BH18VER1_BH18VER1_15740 [soil metagenome]